MEILVVLDHGFVMPTGVMLKSLAFNNKEMIINCHAIIDDNVTEKDKDNLRRAFADRDNCNITFYTIKNGQWGGHFQTDKNYGFHEATYYRLLCASVLPSEVKKVLYFDGDIIIDGKLDELWNIDVEGVAVAGVLDVNQGPDHYNRVRISRKKGYINCGVMLVNVDYWRQHDVESRFMDYLKNHIPKYADQDVINYVLQDEKKMIPLRYNLMSHYLYKSEYAPFFYLDNVTEVMEACSHPIVIHFVSGDKPWHRDSRHPFKNIFLKYYQMSPWAGVQLKRKWPSVKTYAKFFLYKLGWLHENVFENRYAY